jgi:hypothetical protein
MMMMALGKSKPVKYMNYVFTFFESSPHLGEHRNPVLPAQMSVYEDISICPPEGVERVCQAASR